MSRSASSRPSAAGPVKGRVFTNATDSRLKQRMTATAASALFITRIRRLEAPKRNRNSVCALAQIDPVLEIGLEAAAHVSPPLAIAVGELETFLGFRPAGFGDADESRTVID